MGYREKCRPVRRRIDSFSSSAAALTCCSLRDGGDDETCLNVVHAGEEMAGTTLSLYRLIITWQQVVEVLWRTSNSVSHRDAACGLSHDKLSVQVGTSSRSSRNHVRPERTSTVLVWSAQWSRTTFLPRMKWIVLRVEMKNWKAWAFQPPRFYLSAVMVRGHKSDTVGCSCS